MIKRGRAGNRESTGEEISSRKLKRKREGKKVESVGALQRRACKERLEFEDMVTLLS